MSRLDDLGSFPELEGHIPCVLCKSEASRTLVGNHWKCSICAHLFNQDGSMFKLPVPCLCDVCREKAEDEELNKEKGALATLKKLQRKVKRLTKKKKKNE